jgi:hypothetical protein
LIQQEVVNKLSEGILKGEIKNKDNVEIGYDPKKGVTITVRA